MPRVTQEGQIPRTFSEEFKQEAVQMVLDGHSAASVAERWAVGPNLLYRWKRDPSGRPARRHARSAIASPSSKKKLRRVERERDILKKALAILSRQA